ncbi:MAG TPA: tetratricopeptide repeat-containing protein, partial [Stellaceae bacterium]|nr:tetratricopeptide repeat-containing protein [Stellaceae bacterium]
MPTAPLDERAASAQRRQPADWLATARRHEAEGDLFQAYDVAMRGLARFPGDPALQHRAVVCLASTGATRQATELFRRLGLTANLADGAGLTARLRLDIATLHGRLLKDAALAAPGGSRHEALGAAAAAYEACYRHEAAAGNREAYYPGVNAATLHLLAGNRDAAAALARAVLAALASPSGYYEIVSAAEAHLVLGEAEPARRLLRRARDGLAGTAERDFRALASTIRQLRLVVEANRLDAALLRVLAPPRVLHYSGHIIAAPGAAGRFPADQEDRVRREIAAALAAADIGFGYGSLAAGADILFAEALLERGASVHVVLPFDEREFIEQSVRRSGRGWVGRYRRCLAAATSVRYATRDRYLGDDR